jgi:hypothetical protein
VAPAISTFINDSGYITNSDDADADPTNEIQDLQLNENILTITQNGSATQIDLSIYLDNTDTQLSESEVVNIVSNNGFITNPNDADADPTNELQDLSISEGFLGISNGSGVSLDGINYWSKQNSKLYYNSGSVGIGITEPNKLLHLHSESTFFPGGSGPVVETPIKKGLQPTQLSSESTLLLTNKNTGSGATDGLLIRSYDNNAVISLQEDGSLSLVTKKPLRFKMQQNGNISIGTHNTNYFTVNENGNVGIGTDLPAAKLEVKNGSVLVSGTGSGNNITAQTARFIVDAQGSTAHRLMELRNNNGIVMSVNGNGKVGIGTDAPQYVLDVRGEAHFCKVRVKTQGFCDYVFNDDYDLMPLDELAVFIKQNRHLPNIPSEADVVKEGSFELGEMNKMLLEKVEELTLYILQQEERIKALEAVNKQ